MLLFRRQVGDSVKTKVDYEQRHLTIPNHTMTHSLNHALLKVLGEGRDQKGSLNNPEYLRFDFSNNSGVSSEDLGKVEGLVREYIKESLPVYTQEVPKNDALKIKGLRAVFGEDYPDPVRVVSIGISVDQLVADPENPKNADYSIEFCGGTHLTNTAQANSFAIISEEGISKVNKHPAETWRDKLQGLQLLQALPSSFGIGSHCTLIALGMQDEIAAVIPLQSPTVPYVLRGPGMFGEKMGYFD